MMIHGSARSARGILDTLIYQGWPADLRDSGWVIEDPDTGKLTIVPEGHRPNQDAATKLTP